MVAADYWGEGHYTAYPSDKQTVALQIPFARGVMPEHEVVGAGACAVGARGPGAAMKDGEQRVMGA